MAIWQLPIAEIIWDIKYRYKSPTQVIDQNIEDTWSRIAHALALAEKPTDQAAWEKSFYHILENFRFLPGGRILAGAGTAHQVTLFNCFVMDIKEDSLAGIFNALEEGALTLQQGGGVGYDFSVLRPHGDLIKKTGLTSSGPVSFMRIWDTTCSILLSTGARRGAMMGVMRVDHPDIEEFIAAKRNARELRHFNVSVMVTDAFMQAVKGDADWQLVFQGQIYKTIKARYLWEKIIHSAYNFAEPGVLFFDTINRHNNLYYREVINATNPCGEIPLPAYGACDLGAINLTQFVRQPYAEQATIDWLGLEETVRVATRFLDNVIDVSHFPLPAQKEQALGTRRIGLGVTGLADVFVMLGLRYGSAESLACAKKIMQKVSEVTWLTSIELAREKGIFPFYAKEYVQGEFVKTLAEPIYQQLVQHGVRNSHHNTIAPAGTISLLANNISNGIEPIYKAHYLRHVRMIDSTQTYEVSDYAYRLWQAQQQTGLPPQWCDVTMLQPEDHLQVQAVMQIYIDNAISKTINIPIDFPFENLAKVYSRAYELGLKGCTIFRPNPTTGSVLTAPEDDVDKCCQVE